MTLIDPLPRFRVDCAPRPVSLCAFGLVPSLSVRLGRRRGAGRTT
jgi:hypothetical protein